MKRVIANIFLNYIKFWAKGALFFSDVKIIGIAGSVGKTSTKIAAKWALSYFGAVAVTEGNSETGVPLGILGIKQEVYSVLGWLWSALKCPLKIFYLRSFKYLIVEMGTDDLQWPKNMEFLLSVVKPEYVIWLNTSPAHLEQFGAKIDDQNYENNLHLSRLALATEDGKIITKNNYINAIINSDDNYIKEIIASQNGDKIYNFGKDETNNAYLVEYKINFPDTKFKLNVLGTEYHLEFKEQLLAQEYWQVFASVLLLTKLLKLDVYKAIVSLEKNWHMPNGRGVLLKAINESWLIDSSYNASPDAFSSQLRLLKESVAGVQLKPVVVVGDIRELGKNFSQRAHEQLAEEIAPIAKEVYAVGQNCHDYLLPRLKELGINAVWFKNSLELASHLSSNPVSKSLILIKGSQNTIFLETVTQTLLSDKNDVRSLCRQSTHWNNTRTNYYKI